jgi:hypothetical protein
MTNLVISSPGDEESKQSQSQAGADDAASGSGKRRRERFIPDADDCLDALARLPGLLAMGLIKPGHANAMRAIYHEILQHHERSQDRDNRQGLANADVIDLMRKDPKILSVLEPFLSQEQVDMIMQSAGDSDDG